MSIPAQVDTKVLHAINDLEEAILILTKEQECLLFWTPQSHEMPFFVASFVYVIEALRILRNCKVTLREWVGEP